MMVTLQQLLKTTVSQGASDLHLSAGTAPVLRLQKQLIRLKTDILHAEKIQDLAFSLINEEQIAQFQKKNELNFSFGISGIARFRAHYFLQRGSIACTFRQIPFEVPDLGQLGFAENVKELLLLEKGLVLVVGGSGSGKSTSMAAMLDWINQKRMCHIITIEDPIEFLHRHKNSLVNQREIHVDVSSMQQALRYIGREDPDVIFLSEIREKEHLISALQLVQSGHLVLASFPAVNINEAYEKIKNILIEPGEGAWNSFRKHLLMIVGQILIPATQSPSMALAYEIDSALQSEVCLSLANCLKKLLHEQKISLDELQKHLPPQGA